ncbi:MAG: hypothetical protein K6F80_04935, partial [Oscillospiraceae bacterium]|nr:hypothetical protein [Oscillospiraceae bacterium]
TNIRLKNISEYMDLTSKTNYERLFTYESPEKRLERVHQSSRDSARTPVQWTGGKYAGFSSHEPWFQINPNYRCVNVAREETQPDSILNFYRKCLALRKRSKTLLYGRFHEYFPLHPSIFMYERVYETIAYLVICSFSSHRQLVTLPAPYQGKKLQLVLCNYPESNGQSPELAPYEARVYRTRLS